MSCNPLISRHCAILPNSVVADARFEMSVTKERDGEKEKERGSQLRRHVANCRAACSEGNRSRRWRRLREGRSGEMTSGKDETEERTAVRRYDATRSEMEGRDGR